MAGIVVEEKQDIVPKEIARRFSHQQLGICTEKRHARPEHVSTEKIFEYFSGLLRHLIKVRISIIGVLGVVMLIADPGFKNEHDTV